ncbi:MAG: DNA-3-methyladenine glycosylase I [Paraglaciecola sp.]|nr:DNA-3-methyladenine glycosylase I [Paraglaciecola sp.]NCT47040.1 DNA-3-methyladenine glycosylase I [Paraglaciecola sp.]
MAIERCAWVNNDELYQQYHDEVWGRAVFDSQTLFACFGRIRSPISF